MEAARWQPLRTGDGSWTLYQSELGEACHSHGGAWTEAVERYAEPCRVGPRSARRGGLFLLDVGTGAGWNLAAALAAAARSGGRLAITTLEHDAGALEAAFGLPTTGPGGGWLERAHRLLRPALEGARERGVGRARAGGHSLELRLEDAVSSLGALPGSRFDAVFLDPFSPGRDPALWQPAVLASVARCMAPGSILTTYSASLAVRTALLAAGLRVGRGGAVGEKHEGTLASPDRPLVPLAARTRRRAERRLQRLAAEASGGAAPIPGPVPREGPAGSKFDPAGGSRPRA